MLKDDMQNMVNCRVEHTYHGTGRSYDGILRDVSCSECPPKLICILRAHGLSCRQKQYQGQKREY